jgi:hypothetical protein
MIKFLVRKMYKAYYRFVIMVVYLTLGNDKDGSV